MSTANIEIQQRRLVFSSVASFTTKAVHYKMNQRRKIKQPDINTFKVSWKSQKCSE